MNALRPIHVTYLLLLFCSQSLKAQTDSALVRKDYRLFPVWIDMMQDTTANYYETVKAFREFFETHYLPEEPGEKANEGGDSFEKEVGLKTSERTRERMERVMRKRKGKSPEPNYAASVRAFKGWFYGIKPWVRSDGSIIGPMEQAAIIDQQQQELKAIEKANGKN